MISNNVNGNKLDIYNIGTGYNIGDSYVTINHTSGAEEMFDSLDGFWSGYPQNPNPTWMKIYSDPYTEELKQDSRPKDSTTLVHLKLSIVGLPATTPNFIMFDIRDPTNFIWKNIIAEQYGMDDINEPNNIKRVYDIKQYEGYGQEFLISLDNLVSQPAGVYDDWMIRFYDYADLNRDGKVDLKDYAVWAMNYGRTDTMPRNNTNDLGAYADVNRDGVVDFKDLNDFSHEWLWESESL
jgi:hypothetical protein